MINEVPSKREEKERWKEVGRALRKRRRFFNSTKVPTDFLANFFF
jgi:hypothetical protein